MTTIHTPYNPDDVVKDFGWIWLDVGPRGPEWHLVLTRRRYDDRLIIWFPADGGRYLDADRYRGAPYLSVSSPTAEPDRIAALEVTVRLPGGASISCAFGNPDMAARIQQTVLEALKFGHPNDRVRTAATPGKRPGLLPERRDEGG